MRAMVLTAPGSVLRPMAVDIPRPGAGQVLVQVHVCGVCRTDLHVVDGDLAATRYPIVPGHEIVGTVIERGPGVADLHIGDRVGIQWLASTCGLCRYCTTARENLCDNAQFTGYTVDALACACPVAHDGTIHASMKTRLSSCTSTRGGTPRLANPCVNGPA